MKKSTSYLYIGSFAFLAAAAVAVKLAYPKQVPPVMVPSEATATPTQPPIPTPLGLSYSNIDLGLSFQYPEGYYPIEQQQYGRIELQNDAQILTGLPDASFRLIETMYFSGPDSTDEASVKAQRGAVKSDIAVHGGTVRLYSYPNPMMPESTIGEAFWDGKKHFQMRMLWNTTTSSPDDASQQEDEYALLQKVVSTVTITK